MAEVVDFHGKKLADIADTEIERLDRTRSVVYQDRVREVVSTLEMAVASLDDLILMDYHGHNAKRLYAEALKMLEEAKCLGERGEL